MMTSGPSPRPRTLGLSAIMATVAFLGLFIAVYRVFAGPTPPAVEARPSMTVATPIDEPEPESPPSSEVVSPAPKAGPVSDTERGSDLRGSVVGRVLDSRQSPVSSAFVRAIEAGTGQELSAVRTDAEGDFRLEGLPAGEYRLRVFSGRHRALELDGYRVAPGLELGGITIVLDEGERIAGRVVNDDGVAVAGARVGSSDDSTGIGTTDESGMFSLSGLAPGDVSLFATAPGFAPARARGIRAGSDDITMVLNLEAKLHGSIVGLRPGESWLVSVCSYDMDLAKELCVARQVVSADHDGFHFEALAEGQVDVVVTRGTQELRRVPTLLERGTTRELGSLVIVGH